MTALGVDPAKIVVTGSLKFDALQSAPVPKRGPERVLRFFRVALNRPVLMAGSTLRGEEEPVIRAFNRLRATPGGQGALLIIAARHPERFAEVERLCRQEGLATVRRTELPIDAEPRGRRRGARHHRRAGAALSDRHRGVRRRQPRAGRRAQHPRTGRARQGDRVRPLHAQLPGDCRRRSSPTARPSRCRTSASSRTRC